MKKLGFISAIFLFALGAGAAQQPSPPQTPDPSPTEPAAATVFKVGNGISRPILIHDVDARYSDEARQKGIQGICIVSLIVDAQGLPQNIHVTRCVDPLFEPSSLNAVSQYRFKPAQNKDGKPVPVTIFVEVNYALFATPGIQNPHSYCAMGPENKSLLAFFLKTPPGPVTTTPDAQGVYLYTRQIASPQLIHFSDEGYCQAAFRAHWNSTCDVLITLDAKGKIDKMDAPQCAPPDLADQAAASLRKSKFKAGTLNGTPVAIRILMHMEFGDEPEKPKTDATPTK